jgi:Rod binding domain-containing protein
VSDGLRALNLRPEDPVARPVSPPGKGGGNLHQAAVAFEGLLVSTMFQSMRKTVKPSGLLGDSGQAKGTLEYLLDQAIVESAMKGGRTWGLAQRLEEAWKARESKAESKEPISVQELPSPSR